ncbi:TetR/AcrR family transcriptional regulator [bacterium]|nr:TetR/AcrR family transcriptional regulator [bacterium]
MATQRENDKHARILDAATVEIATSGYHKTTVARIARRAGVADGTIYLYFKSKEDMLVAVFERAMDRFISQGILEMGTGDDAVTRIGDIVRLHLEQVGEDRDLAVILQVELRHSLNFLDVFSRSRLRDYLEIITGVIVQGQNEGVFRAGLDPLLAARMIFGVLDQMATDWVLSRREVPLADRAEEVAAFVLGGLRA